MWLDVSLASIDIRVRHIHWITSSQIWCGLLCCRSFFCMAFESSSWQLMSSVIFSSLLSSTVIFYIYYALYVVARRSSQWTDTVSLAAPPQASIDGVRDLYHFVFFFRLEQWQKWLLETVVSSGANLSIVEYSLMKISRSSCFPLFHVFELDCRRIV